MSHRSSGLNYLEKRERSCGKIRYSSYREAIKHSDKLRKLYGEDVRCYRCPSCGKVHVGHVKNIDYDA